MGHALEKPSAHRHLVPETTGFQYQKQGDRPDHKTRFKPGQSGNRNGRPKGSRHKLGEAFLCDLLDSWNAGGRAALDRVREENPVEFLKLVVSILPKDAGLAFPKSDDTLQDMSDEQLAETMGLLQRLVRAEEFRAQYEHRQETNVADPAEIVPALP